MTLRWILAAVHLLALGIGLGAVAARAGALRGVRGPDDRGALARAAAADAWWGVAAALWVSTGLWRLFGGTEKATEYYWGNHLFWTKMALFLAILALEIGPIVAFGRWRADLRRGSAPDVAAAPRYARTSVVQAVLTALMVVAATGMARGLGLGGR